MLLVRIPLTENYCMEFHTRTLACLSFFYSQPILDLHLVWYRNLDPLSSSQQAISWWFHLLMTLFSLFHLIISHFISHFIFFNPLKKSFLSFHLFIDLKSIGVLHLSIHELLSWNHVNLIAEVDCELLVTISHVLIQWNLSEIIDLFLFSSSHQKYQSSILFTLNHWQTASLHQIKLSSHEKDLIETSFDHSSFQYSHPQISLSSSLLCNPSQKNWKWEVHQTPELELLRQHLTLLFSIMKKNVNVFPSQSSLSSPSLHLFFTSLFNSHQQ
jgi:hypothetical protein